MAAVVALTLCAVAIAAPASGAQSGGEISGLTLSSASAGQLTIAWEGPSPDPDDYRIRWARSDLDFLSYRAENEQHRGNDYPDGELNSFTLTSLQKGATYKVQVRTRYRTGSRWSGDWSDVETARVMDDPPAAPTSLSATAGSHDAVTLSWTAPSSGSVAGYRILRGADAESLASLVDDTGDTGTAYTDETVAAETAYVYAVLALGLDGSSPQSGSVSTTTPAAPSLTKSLTKSPSKAPVPAPAVEEETSEDGVQTEPGDADLPHDTTTTGIAVKGEPSYGVVEDGQNPHDADWWAIDLDAGTEYAIRQYGVDTSNCTLREVVLIGVYDSAGDAVSGTEWHAPGRGGWDRVSSFTPSSAGRYYISASGGAGIGAYGTGSYLLAVVDGGEGGAARLDAVAGAGCAAPSTTEETTTEDPPPPRDEGEASAQGSGEPADTTPAIVNPDTLPPGTIQAFAFHSAEIDEYRMTWHTPTPEPDSYLIQWIERGKPYLPRDDLNGNYPLPAPATEKHFDGFTDAGKTYRMRIRAVYGADGDTAAWEGPWTDDVTGRVMAATPAVPANFTVEIDGHNVKLDWDNPTSNWPSGYKILRGASADALTALVDDTANDKSWHLDETVSPETAYHYAVVALNDGGADSAQTATLAITVPPRTPDDPEIDGAPARPAGVTVALENGDAVLSWTDPADTSITGYRILRGRTAETLATIAEDTASADAAYTDAAPAVGQTHRYAVQARNAAGLSRISDTVDITPHRAPYGLTAAAEDFWVDLSWSAPDGAAVTGYRILRGASADDLAVIVGDTGSADAAYQDFTAPPGETMHYAVSAVTASGSGRPSAAVSVETVLPATVVAVVEPEASGHNESRLLVANLNAASTSNGRTVGWSGGQNTAHAAPFNTGANPGGYALTSVRAKVHTLVGDPTVRVTLNEFDVVVSGQTTTFGPGRVIETFQNPDGFSEPVDTFTLPHAVQLNPNTRYTVVFNVASAAGSFKVDSTSQQNADLGNYPSDTPHDSGSYPDWRLAQSGYHKTAASGAWTTAVREAAQLGLFGYEANYQPTLVSNRRLPEGTVAASSVGGLFSSENWGRAQQFRTGPSPQHYTVEAVAVLASGSNNIRISINEDDAGSVGDRLYLMANPANLNAAVDTFRAPQGATLKPDTDYWIVFRRADGATGATQIQRTSLGGRTDSAALPGFTIANAHENINLIPDTPSTSSAPGSSIKFAVLGRPTADVPASTATTRSLIAGSHTHGVINHRGDEDWYKVELQANVGYKIDAHGVPRGGGTAKFVEVRGVYDSSGAAQTITYVDFLHNRLAYRVRAHFTPTASGTYYVAAGSRTNEALPIGSANGTYTVAVSVADPWAADASTTGRITIGRTVHGEISAPVGAVNDTDWLRVALKGGVGYQFAVDGDYALVEFEITGIFDASGNKVKDGRKHPANVSLVHTPTTSGDYFLGVTARQATLPDKEVLVDPACETSCATQTVSPTRRPFAGAEYRIHSWSSDQPLNINDRRTDSDINDPYTTNRLTLGANVANGEIEPGGDRDSMAIWLERGETYVFLLAADNTARPRIVGVREWSDTSLGSFQPRGGGAATLTGLELGCALSSYTARTTGVHLLGVANAGTIRALDQYSVTALHVPGGFESPAVVTPEGCYRVQLLSGEMSHDNRLPGAETEANYLAWLVEGHRYRIDVRPQTRPVSNVADPQLHAIIAADNTRLDVSAAHDAGPGNNDRWEGSVPATGPYLIVAGKKAGTSGRFYWLDFADLGATAEPSGRDLMPDGDRSAGYVSTDVRLNGNLSAGDGYDGFKIDAEPGNGYHIAVTQSDHRAGSLLSQLYLTLWRHDGTAYTQIAATGDQYRTLGRHLFDESLNLYFTAETPPAGTTYTYHATLESIRLRGDADGRFAYQGGYVVALTQDDFGHAVPGQRHPLGAATISTDGAETTGNIERAGDKDSFRFATEPGKHYLIAVRTDESGGDRTLTDAVTNLQWTEGVSTYATQVSIDGAALRAAPGTEAGELFMTHTAAANSNSHYITVGGKGSATGTYTVSVKQVTTAEGTGQFDDGVDTRGVLLPDTVTHGRIRRITFDRWDGDDWMAVPLKAGQGYSFSADFTDRRGRALLFNFDVRNSDGSSAAGVNAPHAYQDSLSNMFFRPAKSDIYYMTIGPTSGVSTTYEIHWGPEDHGQGANTATQITVGQRSPGNLAGPRFAGENSSIDYFKVTLEAGKTYRFEKWGVGKDGVDMGGTLDSTGFLVLPSSSLQSPTEPRHSVHAGNNEIIYREATAANDATFFVFDSDTRTFGTYLVFVEEAHTQVEVSYAASAYDASDAPVTVTVLLDQAPGREVVIPITTSLGGGAAAGDYSGVPATVTFGATETSKTFTITSTATQGNQDKTLTLGIGQYLPREVSTGTPATTIATLSEGTETNQLRINGRAAVGQTLTADTAAVADDDGLTSPTYTYQWRRDGAPITGEVTSSYTLGADDAGHRVSIEASFADDADNAEARTSLQTSHAYAGAQTVLDFNRTTAFPSEVRHRGQVFRTGNNPNGYLLEYVQFYELLFNKGSIQPAQWTAQINAATDSSDVDRSRHTSTKIGSFRTDYALRRKNVNHRLRPEEPILLEPNTNYSMVTSLGPGIGGGCVSGDSGPSVSSHGWDMADHIQILNSSLSGVTDFVSNHQCAMRIRATAVSSDAATITSVEFSGSGRHADYGYDTGDTIDVEVTFSQPVAGRLSIPLAIGDDTVTLSTRERNNSATYRGSLTVTDAHRDDNGIHVADNTITGYLPAELIHHISFPSGLAYSVNARPAIERVYMKSTAPAHGGYYTTGDVIEVAVDFNGPVTVTGDPTFRVNMDGTLKEFAYDSTSSDADTAVFSHTVAAGDADANGIWLGPSSGHADSPFLRLDSDDTIKDGWRGAADKKDANLSHPAPGTQSRHRVDTATARITNVAVTSSPASGDTYATGETIEVTVSFNQNVTVAGDPVFILPMNSGEAELAYTSGSGTKDLVFEYTVAAGDEDTDGVYLGDCCSTNPTPTDRNDIRLDSDDTILSADGTTDANLEFRIRETQTGHKVDGD